MSRIRQITATLERFPFVIRQGNIEQEPKLSFGTLLKFSIYLSSQTLFKLEVFIPLLLSILP